MGKGKGLKGREGEEGTKGEEGKKKPPFLSSLFFSFFFL